LCLSAMASWCITLPPIAIKWICMDFIKLYLDLTIV